jgi:hypothetical protein
VSRGGYPVTGNGEKEGALSLLLAKEVPPGLDLYRLPATASAEALLRRPSRAFPPFSYSG